MAADTSPPPEAHGPGRSSPGRSSPGAPADPLAYSPLAPDPLALCLGVILAGYGLLFVLSLAEGAPIRLVHELQAVGLDFADFWRAAADVLAGRDPYARARFVTPPVSALPFLPLAALPLKAAIPVFFAANLAALAASALLLTRRYRIPWRRRPLFFAALLFSPAALMLLQRGNIDGIVLLLTAAFLAAKPDSALGAGALALAAMMKAYPVLLLIDAAVRRRWRAVLIGAGLIALSAALLAGPYLGFLHNQLARGGRMMRLDENLSFISIFWLLARAMGQGGGGALILGEAVFVAALAAAVRLDLKLRGRLSRPDQDVFTAAYAAFFVGFPPLVYLYSGVSLYILLAALAAPGVTIPPPLQRRLAILIGMAMLPVKSLAETLPFPPVAALNVIPPMANLALIGFVLAARVEMGRGKGIERRV